MEMVTMTMESLVAYDWGEREREREVQNVSFAL